jgi:hypothetical protein
MARVKVKRVVQLPDKDKTVLKPGEGMIHTIDDDIMSHWFIQVMVESGDIIIVTEENQKQKVLPYNRPKVAISTPKVVEIKPQDDKLVVPRIEVNYLEEKEPVVVETKVEEVKEVKSKINKRK